MEPNPSTSPEQPAVPAVAEQTPAVEAPPTEPAQPEQPEGGTLHYLPGHEPQVEVVSQPKAPEQPVTAVEVPPVTVAPAPSAHPGALGGPDVVPTATVAESVAAQEKWPTPVASQDSPEQNQQQAAA